ncbi:TPA: hypothetical protein ACH7GJ_005447 [Escherichia coli]
MSIDLPTIHNGLDPLPIVMRFVSDGSYEVLPACVPSDAARIERAEALGSRIGN